MPTSAVTFSLTASLVFLMTFLSYWPALFYDFAYYDDYGYIVDDPAIHAISFVNMLTWLTSIEMAYWGPTTRFSYAIDYAFWHTNPLGFHLSNHLLHASNAVLLLLLTYNVLRLPRFNHSPTFSLLAATVAALLFGLHPQNVEAVAWIASRKDVLSVCLFLLTIVSYLRYTQTTNHKKAWYFISLGCFVLAIGAKPIVMSLPIILLLFDYYPLQRIHFNLKISLYIFLQKLKPLLLEKIPFLLLALIPALLAIYSHAQTDNLADFERLPIDIRLMNAANMVLMYLIHTFIPFSLSAFYAYPEFYELNLLPVLGVLLITLWLVVQRHAYPVLFTTWLFFLLTVFPTLGLISFNQIQAGADRFTYLPTLMIYSVLGLGVAFAFYATRFKWFITVLISMVLIGLFYLNQQQQTIWQNDVSLWQHVTRTNPEHFIGYYNLALAYQRIEQPDLAIQQLQIAVQVVPDCVPCYYQLADLYLKRQQLTTALQQYQAIVQRADGCIEKMDTTYFNMALIYYRLRRVEDAAQQAALALQCNPQHEGAQELLRQLTS